MTAVLTFDSEQVCASRRGLGGVWRVMACVAADPVRPVRVARACSVLPFAGSEKVLLLGSIRPYRRGVMVNPRKIALEYLRAATMERVVCAARLRAAGPFVVLADRVFRGTFP